MVTSYLANLYSFRSVVRFVDPAQPDTTALSAIESGLVEANTAFLRGQYQHAIAVYQRVAGLIYAQINPRFPPWFDGVYSVLPKDTALFDTVLSLGAEWANVVPVNQPNTSVRPRVPVDPRLLESTARYEGLGVSSASLSNPSQVNALADWQLAKLYAEQSNQAQSAFFLQRAEKTDPETVRALGSPDLTAPQPGADAVLASPAGLDRAAVRQAPNLRERLTHGLQDVLGGSNDVAVAAIQPRPALDQLIVNTPSLPPVLTTGSRSVGILSNDSVKIFKWDAGQAPPIQDIKVTKYVSRVSAIDLRSLVGAFDSSAVALELPHDYYYVIPLGLAECYHALGDYATAESHYFEAGRYQYLNQAIEAPYLWLRLATLYLDWGNALYRSADDNPGGSGDAAIQYQKVLQFDGTVPTTAPLYTLPALKPGADQAAVIVANLGNLIDKSLGKTVTVPDVNPALSAVILGIHQELLKIEGGLDFWGHWTNTVPIWTFDYLQNAAVNFTQLAINAEKDFISFRERADQATLNRQQLQQGVAQATTELDAAQAQIDAAAAEETAYQDGVALAKKRRDDAIQNVSDYANSSWMSIQYQAASQQLAGGDDGDPNQLNGMADALQGIGPSGQLLRQGWHLEGSGATLAAANQLAASRYTREFEIASMNRQAQELDIAATQAGDELKAGQARTKAARAEKAVAAEHQRAATDNLTAFDNQFFTPDVWYRMGDTVWRLYRRYLHMAIRTARLMQRAYNFETDQTINWVKSDYSTDEVKGLLGAEALLADIQGFTFDLITSHASKPQAIKQTISLYNQYGFAFENQLRKTGVMEFQTRIDDFDMYYPGTYAGRIEAVEVEVVGVLPPSGISGTLTNSGISAYRTPSSVASGAPGAPGKGLKFRIQSRETLVLSDYSARQDALFVPGDSRVLKIMQGAGLASTWRLELPRAINDIDYGALTDVRVTFYYKARYDPVLHDTVIAELAASPGVNTRQRTVPLRWTYPDAYFHFQDTGTLSIKIAKSDFRTNETDPQLLALGLVVITDGSVPAGGITVSLQTPTHAPLSAVTDATGQISTDPISGWTPLASGTVLGGYTLHVDPAANPQLVKNGKLDLKSIVNVALVMKYQFSPRA